jgi:two-component system, NtrC family, response regulator HydG
VPAVDYTSVRLRRADTQETLHAAKAEAFEEELLALALARTGAVSGALFLWDPAVQGLVLAHHVVEGLNVTFPDRVLTPGGERAGIAMWAFENNEPYLCRDSRRDPHYTRYILDVRSIAAAPLRYQRRPIGVITVSAPEPGRFGQAHLDALEELAQSSAALLRRAQLDRQSRRETGRPFLIKGLCPEWLEVERRIEYASPTSAPILLRGESGTGKDLVARAVHFNSRRADKPFVTVNCAAIPEALLESILFGHVRGAFTGATFDKIGEFQKADGGTLFLDEVGELPVMLQAKVLRAVEQGEVQPLGSNEAPARVDVRLIGATNRDLETMTRDGTFRGDLYYRLSVMTMELPPLRAYKDNLEVLAHVFVEQAAAKHERPPPRVSADAMARLHAYDYPGNVRELKNAMEHAVIMCAGDVIEPGDLPRPFWAPPAGAASAGEGMPAAPPRQRASLREMRELWLAPLERRYLLELLDECGGNVRDAAARAGINPVTMYRMLRKRGVEIRREIRGADDKLPSA